MTDLTIYDDLTQGTDEWIAARAGMVTASTVGKLLTPTGNVANNDTARTLTLTLAAERITGHVEETPMTPAMWRGVEEEPLARAAYEEHRELAVTEIGFMVRQFPGFRLGYSPDGLVGVDGLIEIKSRDPKVHMRTVMADKVPAANMAQLQAGLLVSGREWCDYISFCAGMALWIKRVYPDPQWAENIAAACEKFETECAGIIGAYKNATRGLPIMDRRTEPQDIVI